jgi:chloramphenicol-sensitive protein RarD
MTRGVAASISASVLFALLFYYATLLDPLSGEEVFGWRMLFNAPVISTMVLSAGDWRLVSETAVRVRRTPLLALGILGTATLIGAQLWVFVW